MNVDEVIISHPSARRSDALHNCNRTIEICLLSSQLIQILSISTAIDPLLRFALVNGQLRFDWIVHSQYSSSHFILTT